MGYNEKSDVLGKTRPSWLWLIWCFVQNVYFPFDKVVICHSDNDYESALTMHLAFQWIKLLDDASLIKPLVLVKPQSNFALLPLQLIFIPMSTWISSSIIRGGLYFR